MEYLVSDGKRPTPTLNALPFARQLGGLLADSHLEIYLFDARSLCFLQVSEGARRNLGYTDAELRRMTPVDIKPRFDREAFEAALAPLRDGREQLVQFETCHRRKNGSEYPVWVRLQFFANESPPVFLALLEDISERRETEQALVRQGEVLAEADERKNAFLATLGHELRSPVAAIQNALSAERRRTGADPDPHTVAVLELVDRQVRQISGLVDGLLDLSLISRGKIRLNLAPLPLAKLAESAVEAVRPAIEQRRQQLHVDIHDAELWVTGDATRLVQVFTNLLSNASKYTPDARQVWLSIHREHEDVLIEVRDEGQGIRAEELPYIFEPFTQPRASERTQGGLGLGLSLAKGLVALHGGDISAASPGENQGAVMRVRLPALLTGVGGRPH